LIPDESEKQVSADEEGTVARIKLLFGVVAMAAAFAVPAANAGLFDSVGQLVAPTCGSNSYPFARFNDNHPYYGFTNNGFESGAYGWSLSGGASVGFGNEPWYLNGWGSRSLVLPAGASATSPGFCINLFDPAVRMTARGTNGSNLTIQVLFHGITGNLTGIFNYDSETGSGSWEPTNRASSQLALPILTSYAQIRVTAESGTWQVDDAFVDPSIGRIG
jgi:hypothetical protein